MKFFIRILVLLPFLRMEAATAASCSIYAPLTKELDYLEWFNTQPAKDQVCADAVDGDLCNRSHNQLLAGVREIRSLLSKACPSGGACTQSGGNSCLAKQSQLASGVSSLVAKMNDFSSLMNDRKLDNLGTVKEHMKAKSSVPGTGVDAFDGTAYHFVEKGLTSTITQDEIRKSAKPIYDSKDRNQLFAAANMQEAKLKIDKILGPDKDLSGDLKKYTDDLNKKKNNDSSLSGLKPADLAKMAGALAPLAAALMKQDPQATDPSTQPAGPTDPTPPSVNSVPAPPAAEVASLGGGGGKSPGNSSPGNEAPATTVASATGRPGGGAGIGVGSTHATSQQAPASSLSASRTSPPKAGAGGGGGGAGGAKGGEGPPAGQGDAAAGKPAGEDRAGEPGFPSGGGGGGGGGSGGKDAAVDKNKIQPSIGTVAKEAVETAEAVSAAGTAAGAEGADASISIFTMVHGAYERSYASGKVMKVYAR